MLFVLRSVQGPTQTKSHCLKCHIYEEDGESEALMYLELWDSRVEFHAHVRSELYRRVLGAMELSKSAPELWFYQVAMTHGLELVRQLRDPYSPLMNATPSDANTNTRLR